MSNTVSTNLDGLERTLNHSRAHAKEAAARWAFGTFPRLAGSVLEVAAAGFEPPASLIFSRRTSARLLPR